MENIFSVRATKGIFLAYTSVFLETMKANKFLAGLAGKITRDALNRAMDYMDGDESAEVKPNWIVYKGGDPFEDRVEDEGRTSVVHVRGLPEKVYAILEDYGDPETWDDVYPPDVVADLRAVDMRRHKLTIMFSSEY